MALGLEIPIGGDLTGLQNAFRRAVSDANKAGSNIASGMNASFMAAGVAVAGFGAAVAGIGAAVSAAFMGIGKAAELETLETAFTPLLGSADAAKARIAELAKFAAETPFELPEIAKASKVLEVLTKGALATGDGLTLVGDAASAAGQPFSEVAMWIGRLYDGLQSGRPVGEAMMRLQEMGLISGDVRGKLEGLQKTGASGPEIWSAAQGALGRFGGSMELQSKTWGGLMSTFKDSIGAALAAFGKPIMDALKPYLASAIGMAESMAKQAVAFGTAVGKSISFIAAAFSSGNLTSIIATALKLGFAVSVNFLYAHMRGVFGAIGQLFVENIKTGIAVFQILLTPDFWKGLGNALVGIFLDATGFLMRGISNALEMARPLAELFGKGDSITNAQAGLTAGADDLRARADARFATSGNQLGPAFDAITARLAETLANVTERYQKVFQATPELIGTDGFKEALAGQMQTIRDLMAAAEAAKKSAAPSAASTPPGDIATAVGQAAAPAVMSLARIGGGGGPTSGIMSSLYAETRNQTTVLKKIADNTAKRPTTAATYA